METGALKMDTTAAPGHRGKASVRRQAWAQSRDSEQEHCDPQDPQQSQADTDTQTPSKEPGQVPSNIASWLIECRTPLGASLDDQSAPPSRGTLRNGCSFEDDLSLGAEANHLQSANNKTESCFGLKAEQKRSQFKERGRSMNSTGSGKSSTVSSVSELLDLYEEDPEEILLNLGFGREEPDLASKVPSRFFNGSSAARGIDIKVYLGAQMQRMEVENPNYALTSRFRQIEVLTTVANEFFQLYSQVSGQPVKCISTRDQGGEGVEGAAAESSPPLKRTSSARDVAKRLIRRLTKNNLTANSEGSLSVETLNEVRGHGPSDDATLTNGYATQEQDSSTDTDREAEAASPKHSRKKDTCPLATVTEESNGDVDTDRLTGNSPEQSSAGPAASGEPQTASADLQSTNQTNVERNQVVKEEEDKKLISALEKLPATLAPPQLAQFRTEKADSFEIEEIQSNEDEALPNRTSRANDLLRTVSQQSDSSGFAEDSAADSNSNLRVQESSDSCDSETTVTSHPSQDVTTPVPMDQPVFNLPERGAEEVGPGGAAETDGTSSPREENKRDGVLEEVPQYTAHQLPKRQVETQQSDTLGEECVGSEDRTISDPELEPESTHSAPASEQEQQHIQKEPEISSSTEAPTEGVGAEGVAQEVLGDSGLRCPPPASSPVLCALNRAKQIQLSRAGQGVHPLPGEVPKTLERGRGRRCSPMQRSSSLPTSLLSPSRVVSSVRIQFGQGQAACTLPRYSFMYTQEAEGDDDEDEVEKEEEEEGGHRNCQSTLLINPASSTRFNNKPTRLPTDTPIPPKPIPRYLLRSSCSPQSSSPPPDWSTGGRAHYWSTQSVPDLSSNQHQPGHFQENISSKQNQQSWNPGQVLSSYLNPNPNPAAQYLNPSPGPSPGLNPSPYACTPDPPPQNLSRLPPYGSLPNIPHHLSQSSSHHASTTSLHQPTAPTVAQHASVPSFHQPPAIATSHHVSLGSPHPGSPIMHHQGYSYPYSHQPPYHVTPHGSPYGSSYLIYHGYGMHPHLAYPQPVAQCPPPVPEHGLHVGLHHPASGFFPGVSSALGQGHSLHPGLTPAAAPGPASTQGPSSTEMQLRRVLHDIRGTVQSLSQNRADTPDGFSERRTPLPSQQSLAEFQQKRRSLNLFRSQMMDLELSIIRQQAVVYKHLSPVDRLEVEQLHSLRSAVREELQELEQQLEDRLMELTHGGLHRGNSVDSLSTASALRAMDPVSDLLREQLFLQSELSYDGRAPSTNPSTRSSSPVGGDDEQRQSVYRASINITPAPPPRPDTHCEEEGERDTGGGREPGGGGTRELPEERRGAEGVKLDNLQQLIREIRDSVAQEVRQEIYGELLAAVSPRRSPLPARQQPL